MKKTGIRYPNKRVFILDELAVVAAFFASLIIRYRGIFFNWYTFYEGLYVSLLLVLCLLKALIFLTYDVRKKSIFEQDPFENLVSVVKGSILLMVFCLLYLYTTQRGEQSSRFVIAALFVLLIVFGYTARMIYRGVYIKRHASTEQVGVIDVFEPFPDIADLAKTVSNRGDVDVLIHQGDIDATYNMLKACEKAGIRAYVSLVSMGYDVKQGIVEDVNGYASIPACVRKDKFDLFGVKYSIAGTEEAVRHVIEHAKELAGEFICFSNVHTTVMARENKDYRETLNNAAFVFPDGTPIAVLQQQYGIFGAERVAGPDFMEHMFRNTQDGKIGHYFYGASEETIKALRERLLAKYPGINIKGMYSPPFRELTDEEDSRDVEMINASGADLVWIGLGAPKQEKWMNAHKGRINGVMLGVGAGFDFHAGTIKRAPIWVQKVGFEWLFRLFQDPGRLFKRYFVTNGKFIWYLLTSRN